MKMREAMASADDVAARGDRQVEYAEQRRGSILLWQMRNTEEHWRWFWPTE